ncbi:MAG: IucA/IucC family C-terminal-domain containing protein [Minisyncoccota bacterium]
MKLDDLLRGTGTISIREANFICMERYVNDAKGNFKDYSEVDTRYSPEIGEKHFSVPYKLVGGDDLTVLRSTTDPLLEQEIVSGHFAKFLWHPDLEGPIKGKPDGSYFVSPTSSTRTLLTQGLAFNFMIKTDLDKKHFRFRRRLKGSSVAHSIDVNHDLSEAVLSKHMSFYGYLPESLGLIYGDRKTGTGVIFREINPRPNVNDHRQLIPYFSLYSRDSFFLHDIPLIIQLIEHNSHADPLGFFVNVLVGFIQDAWVHLVNDRGVLPELHGQNALLEIDSTGIPTRIVHRDFQSLYSDRDIRTRRNIPQFTKHFAGTEDNITKDQQYSLVFDHFISKYLFERMVKSFIEFYPKYSFRDVSFKIGERFKNIPNNRLDVFPETVFRFSKQVLTDNHVTLVDTGEIPMFR